MMSTVPAANVKMQVHYMMACITLKSISGHNSKIVSKVKQVSHFSTTLIQHSLMIDGSKALMEERGHNITLILE